MSRVFFRNGGPTLRVGKILCVGRNYPEHAREMKAEVPKEPVVFIKPATAIVQTGGSVELPPYSHDVHHEVELVVVIGNGGRNIPRTSAIDHVAGYAVGLDMTLRDVQADAKKKGLPWTVAKGFDTSAPLSHAAEKLAVPDPGNLSFSLAVNKEVRQRGNTRDMIFPVDALIAYLSGVFTLEPGDLIFTGTPEGVGPVRHGDLLTAELETLTRLEVHVR